MSSDSTTVAPVDLDYRKRCLDDALTRGWWLCRLDGKKPVQRGWQKRSCMLVEEATYWAILKGQNVGVRCGVPDGGNLLVIDCDPGADIDALELPPTVTAITGRPGGRHYYFTLPAGVTLGCGDGALGESIQTKGAGGQVVLPGSIHPDTGRMYRWAEGRAPWERCIVVLPEHILERLRRPKDSRKAHRPTAGGNGHASRYALAALHDELQRIRIATEGRRNDTLNVAAFALGQLVGGGELDVAVVEASLFAAALEVGLPEAEARATIRSGLEAGKQEPRTPPPRKQSKRRKAKRTARAAARTANKVGESGDSDAQLLPAITNFEIEVVETPEGQVERVVPLKITDIIERIRSRTGNAIKRIGDALLAAQGKDILWLNNPASLFGFLGEYGIIRWKVKTEGCVTKSETFERLRQCADAYDELAVLPHEPKVRGVFYACAIPEPGQGKHIEHLLSMLSPETELDRELLLAAFATPLWGAPPGRRPAFLITAPRGRGKGKSKTAQLIGRLYGGCIDVSADEDISKLKSRLLSADAATLRVCLLDNLKTSRFSWGQFEALVTCDRISGHRLYVGNASRPNLLTHLITLNGPSLSADMASRVVEIRLTLSEYSESWEETVDGFVDKHRDQVIADLVGFLRRPKKRLEQVTRWATWESHVLSKVPHPNECIDLICERRRTVDVDAEESELIESYFEEQLQRLGYDTQFVDIFIPNAVCTRWVNGATGERRRLQGLFHALGVSFSAGGGSAVARKKAARLMDRLATGRLVEKTLQGRSLFVRLTDVGESLARRLCDWPDLRFTARCSRELPTDWIAEPWLFRLRPPWLDDIDQLRAELDLTLTPGLIRGWAQCRTTISGLGVWRRGPKPIPADDELSVAPAVKPQEAMAKLYIASFKRQRHDMCRQPYGSELGELPFPESEAWAAGRAMEKTR